LLHEFVIFTSTHRINLVKQGVPRRTVYNILNKFLKYGQTKFLPKTGRPFKLSNKDLNQLVKSVNNRSGVSQRKLAKRFKVLVNQLLVEIYVDEHQLLLENVKKFQK
jgi:hypothetical protein